jgi:hypothetical protein
MDDDDDCDSEETVTDGRTGDRDREDSVDSGLGEWVITVTDTATARLLLQVGSEEGTDGLWDSLGGWGG